MSNTVLSTLDDCTATLGRAQARIAELEGAIRAHEARTFCVSKVDATLYEALKGASDDR